MGKADYCHILGEHIKVLSKLFNNHFPLHVVKKKSYFIFQRLDLTRHILIFNVFTTISIPDSILTKNVLSFGNRTSSYVHGTISDSKTTFWLQFPVSVSEEHQLLGSNQSEITKYFDGLLEMLLIKRKIGVSELWQNLQNAI
jgi:hypothetical protein